MAKFKIQDAAGALAEVDVDMSLFRAAADGGHAHGLRKLDVEIQTAPEGLTASQQVYAQLVCTARTCPSATLWI